MKKINLLVVGISEELENLVKISKEIGLNIVAVLDDEQIKLKSWEKYNKISYCNQLGDLDKNIQAVLVNDISNEEMIKFFITRGIHVILGKCVSKECYIKYLAIAKKNRVLIEYYLPWVKTMENNKFKDAIKAVIANQKIIEIRSHISEELLPSLINMLLTSLPSSRPFLIDKVISIDSNEKVFIGSINKIPFKIIVTKDSLIQGNLEFKRMLYNVSLFCQGGELMLSSLLGPILWKGCKINTLDKGNNSEYLYESVVDIVHIEDSCCFKDMKRIKNKHSISLLKKIFNKLAQNKQNPKEIQKHLLFLDYLDLFKKDMNIVNKVDKFKPFYSEKLKEELRNKDKKTNTKDNIPFSYDYLKSAIRASEKVVIYSICYFLTKYNLFQDSKTGYDFEEIVFKINASKSNYNIIRRWLNKLEKNQYIEYKEGKYYGSFILTEEQVQNAINKRKYLWDNKISTELSMKYLEDNISNLDKLVSGRINPTLLLFPNASLEYANSLYKDTIIFKYLNKTIAEIVKMMVCKKENKKKKLKILEIGAGTGGTTDTVLNEIEDNLGHNVEYHYTDLSEFFLNSAKKRYKSYEGIKYSICDIDKSFSSQGFAEDSIDIVIANGVINNAKDINKTIGYIYYVLKVNGWVLISEPMEESLEILVSQVFMMPNDKKSEKSTFLTFQEWLHILEDNSFRKIKCYPNDKALELFNQKLFLARKG